MRAAARPSPVPEPPPYAYVYPRAPGSAHLTKIGIPVAALALGWAIATAVFGAGGKLGGGERDLAYLTSRCDTLASGLTESRARAQADHDEIIKLQVEIASLKEEEAGKNITISMDPKDKK